MIRQFTLAAVFALASISHASALNLNFVWGPTKKCFDPKSPPMVVTKVPDGTTKLRFKMVDLNAPNYPHGGGTVKWSGKKAIPYGAFRYKGPCPPSPHTYRIAVQAIDAKGKVLAKASAKRRFP